MRTYKESNDILWDNYFSNLDENIMELNDINKWIKVLDERRQELIVNVIDGLGHKQEGQKTYYYDKWKVTVKTPCTYSLNKKLYESGDVSLPAAFNPIKESIAYSIDKKLCEHFLTNAPQEIKDSLVSLIDKRPGSKTISVEGIGI